LQLALSPLAQGDTLSLVVDRAALTTRVSKDGEVITDARYFVKNRGNPHFRLVLPEGTTLWSVTVNGATVVPVKEGAANLIPLPQRADPNAVQILDLKLASRSTTPKRVTVAAPVVTAPVLLAEWNVQPDTGQRLVYRGGSLAPAAGVADASGFVGLARMLRDRSRGAVSHGAGVDACSLFWVWRWAVREKTPRFSTRHLGGDGCRSCGGRACGGPSSDALGAGVAPESVCAGTTFVPRSCAAERQRADGRPCKCA
jgi:hypothetical protein